MKLRKIIIKNFRCLADVSVPIGDTTVIIGENNSGKTALLEALRIALRRSIGKATPFNEYDYLMAGDCDTPQKSEGILIELWFHEDSPDEWPDSIALDLNDIIQTDPLMDLDYIGLRLISKYDESTKEILTKWEFLTLDGQPLGGKGANPINTHKFQTYIRSFYLSSLRDSEFEFSPRSKYWSGILKDLKITEEQKKALKAELEKINKSLLNSDPRLQQVISTLDKTQEILEFGSSQKTSIQALPLKPWDLMSKSEVFIKTRGNEISFPIAYHGQGTQSLAVLFLFQAYIEVLLKPTFKQETEALLALEEPEAHLHPQAIRMLASNLNQIKSQKIISTHSPYFIQEIPFKHIVMFRRDGSDSKVLYIRQTFTAEIPEKYNLISFCKGKAPKYSYHPGIQLLSLNGKMNEREYSDLQGIYKDHEGACKEIERFKNESQLYLRDDELADLDMYAKRIRGEVLFARAWLLCEGQCEYMLLRYFAGLLGTPLDQARVAVIDYQNNGSVGAFVGLARTFEIPWVMTCDNDGEKDKFITQIKERGLKDSEINELVKPLPGAGIDIEKFLVGYGFKSEYLQIIGERGIKLNHNDGDLEFENEISDILKSDKTGYTILLIEKLRKTNANASRVPVFFGDLIRYVIAKVA